jgi:hypothetical protein
MGDMERMWRGLEQRSKMMRGEWKMEPRSLTLEEGVNWERYRAVEQGGLGYGVPAQRREG